MSVVDEQVQETQEEAPVAPEEQPESAAKPNPELIDVLTPRREPKRWIFVDIREFIDPQTGQPDTVEGSKYVFVQRPLSYFRKLEFLKMMSDGIKGLIEGPDGLSINQIFDMLSTVSPNLVAGQTPTPEMFADGETVVRLITKLGSEAPGLLLDLYALFLNVPAEQKPLFNELVQRPVELGGLSDNDGIEILEIFVDQNLDVMRDFFKQYAKLGRRAQMLLRKVDAGSTEASRP